MRIFNVTKTQELHENELNLEIGYLKADRLFIAHHEAVSEMKEQGHYETIKEYPNGGKDLKWVVDVPAIEAKDAWDEYEDIQVYVPYTEAELSEKQLNALRCERELLLIAFDKYKSNVEYGIEKESQIQHEDMIAWYEDLLDLEKSAFANIPQRVQYYL
ncbi:MAG: hypothetical protein NC131_01105 [Roseburia sp.]|nr:hypothetical protein [Roseburia sp.]